MSTDQPLTGHPLVVQRQDCPQDGWSDPQRGAIAWWTLFGRENNRCGAVTAGVAEVAPGDELKCHYHAPAEIYFFLSGEGEVHIAGVDYAVRAETAAFIPGNAVHGIRNTGAVPLRLFYLFPVNTFADVEYHFVEG